MPNGKGLRIGIVAALWHDDIVSQLLSGALDTLTTSGVALTDITIVRAPGSFEIPNLVKHLATKQKLDAVVALGVIIRGDTPHFEYISSAVAQGLMDVSTNTLVPCIFGVLTTDTHNQARERAGGIHGNKGSDAAIAAIQMANTISELTA